MRLASICPTHAKATVAARIEVGMEAVLFVAGNEYRFFAHVRREELPRPAHLALVSEEEPATPKDLFLFDGIQAWIGIEAAAHQSAVITYQGANRIAQGSTPLTSMN